MTYSTVPSLNTQMLVILLACLTVSGLGNEVIHHHSLEPPYITDGWEQGIPYWEIGGSSIVTNSYVRLTPDQSSRVGWIWNKQAGDLSSWQATLKFRIHSKKSPGADGIGVWYIARPKEFSEEGPLWGAPTNFTGLGIIMDTYDNDMQRDNPAVVVIVGTGEHRIWDLAHDLNNEARIKCVLEYRNTAKGNGALVRVIYHQRKIEVFVRLQQQQNENLCGVAENVDLPQGYHFAASASTGHLVDTHELYSFEVTPAPGTVAEHDPQLPLVGEYDPEADRKEREYWAAKADGNEQTPPSSQHH